MLRIMVLRSVTIVGEDGAHPAGLELVMIADLDSLGLWDGGKGVVLQLGLFEVGLGYVVPFEVVFNGVGAVGPLDEDP